MMGIAISMLVIAAGAVLAVALERTVQGVAIDTVGVVLMIAGVFGLLASVALRDRLRPSTRGRHGSIVHDRRTRTR